VTIRSSPLALTVLALLMGRPLHPYGIQRLIKQWGKDQVVNAGDRTALYRTIDRLHRAGLIAVRQTERDRLYPERTVYEITGPGRAIARRWLEAMLATPKAEYPEFPAALSYVMMLTPAEALSLLEGRLAHVRQTLSGLASGLAQMRDLPRVSGVETEYLYAVTAAEEKWLAALADDLRDGRLVWSPEDFAEAAEDA